MSSNVYVRDVDLAEHNVLDNRRLELVADGLSLWNGSQLAIDTTLVSPLHRDGRARRKAATHNGAALQCARRRKTITYPELSGEGGRITSGGVGGGSGGTFLRRSSILCARLGKGKVPQPASDPARSCQSSRLPTVGRHPRVHRGEVICSVVAGPPTSVQHWNGPALGERSGAGFPFLVRCRVYPRRELRLEILLLLMSFDSKKKKKR